MCMKLHNSLTNQQFRLVLLVGRWGDLRVGLWVNQLSNSALSLGVGHLPWVVKAPSVWVAAVPLEDQ